MKESNEISLQERKELGIVESGISVSPEQPDPTGSHYQRERKREEQLLQSGLWSLVEPCGVLWSLVEPCGARSSAEVADGSRCYVAA